MSDPVPLPEAIAGLLIIPADVIRMLSNELIVPERVDRPAWDLGPLLLMFAGLAGVAVIPFGRIGGVSLQIADTEVGIADAFAVASLASLGVVMGGYASNNKFSLLGAVRAVAQNVAYDIPLVVTAASVVLLAGTLRTSGIVTARSVARGADPLATVAGHTTEYSSAYFVLYYAGEFVHIYLGGALVATLFPGGPAGPWLPGPVWFLLKMAAVPRIRIGQLIEVGRKGLLALSFANLLLTAAAVPLIL